MRVLRAVGAGALSWPSLAVAATICVFALHALAQSADRPDADGWDVAVPTLGNLQLVPLLIALLWVPVVITRHRALTREEVVLRHGSWRAAVTTTAIDDAASLCGALGLSVLTVLVISANRGLGGQWSGHVRSLLEHGGADTEVSAAAAATFVSSPWLFVLLQAAWLAAGLWCLAALHAAALVVAGPRTAHGLLAVTGVWGVIAGSGALGPRVFPDPSAWTNVLWALASPPSVVLALTGWVLGGLSAWGAATVRDGRARDLVPPGVVPALVFATATGALLLRAWSTTLETGQEGVTSLLDAALAGPHGSLAGHVLTALPAAALAGVVVARLPSHDDGRLELVVLRHGSCGRWARRVVVQGVAVATLGAVALVALTALADRVLTPSAAPRPLSDLVLVATSHALFAVMVMLLGLVLLWTRGGVREWPVAVLVLLLLGYPFLLPATVASAFAPFGVEPGTSVPPTAPSPALAVATVLACVLVLSMHRSRLPRPS